MIPLASKRQKVDRKADLEVNEFVKKLKSDKLGMTTRSKTDCMYDEVFKMLSQGTQRVNTRSKAEEENKKTESLGKSSKSKAKTKKQEKIDFAKEIFDILKDK